VTLSHQASAEFFAAADLVTSPSPRNGAPDFRVCKNAEAALLSLEKAGRATISDWPPVAATSEKPASVLAGGEFPILIPVTDGRVAVKWKRFGYWAEVVPRWLETGRLQLDITPEIASKDFAHAVISNGLTIPGLTTRRVCARVEMNLGETAVINLGPVPTNPDDEPTPAPSQPDRPATSRTSERSRSKHPAAERTITLFLVTPTAARPASGANVEP
jgi:pilus assembly protein CpaC